MNPTHKIIPHLWFDKEAIEAARFYISLFPNSGIKNITSLQEIPSPSGNSDIVSFELNASPFMAINAGPIFQFNPLISFIVNYDPSIDPDAKENLKKTWEKLFPDGKVMMPLQQYPFSELYGWIQDKYGISWQFILSRPDGEKRPFITPSLLFTEKVCGKAEEAVDFYLSLFSNSSRGITARYPKDSLPDQEGDIMFSDFKINDTFLAAADSAQVHGFTFSEAISFIIKCDTQEEIDYFWDKLSAVPEAEQCGWLKDKYGISWQITPSVMSEMMKTGSREQINRVTKAFLPMKKFEIKKLEDAFRAD
ncbi:MAG: VOC family protein [Leptospiraceae bacterium]|nr:VOC family protein [Leptospiraceae bacterium]MCP5500753.1 VOC family protein [Leptospiraceae bacterium]